MSLLLQLIPDLSPTERRAAHHWLASPLHNSKPALACLFSYLDEWIHDLQMVVDETAAYRHVYPSRKYTPKRWAKLAYELLTCLEDLLAYQRFQQNTFARRNELLHFYRERGLNNHLQTRINRYQSKYPKQAPSAASDRFFHDHQLKKEAYFLSATSKRSAKHNLEEQEDSLLLATLSIKFRQACETLAHLRLFPRETYQLPLLQEMLDIYASQQRPDLPGVHLFYLATLLYRSDANDALFQSLKAGIETHIDDFPPQDQRNLLVLAINHCLRQANTGRKEFLRQSLDLYELGLKRKRFYDNGRIGIFTFNNILGVALRLEEVDWAADFLETNVRRLPEDKREEVESLSRARLSFQRKDYNQTLHYLRTADYKDIIHHLTARVMQLKIYFERDDFNLLTSHIRATKSLLRRKKNLGYHQRNYLNIFSLTEKIVKLPPGDKKSLEALKKKIEKTEPCTEKQWLLDVLTK